MSIHRKPNTPGHPKKRDEKERRPRHPRHILNKMVYEGILTRRGIIVLISIAVALGILMMVSLYLVRAVRLDHMDQTAKEIFVAAQNNLTAAEKSGELASIIEDSYDGTTTMSKNGDLGYLMTVNPSDSGISDKQWKKEEGSCYYLVYSPIKKDNMKKGILKTILPEGSVDETVRTGGSYIIEYNIDEAKITGVFYTRSENGFTESDDSQKGKYLNKYTGSASAESRSKSVRSNSAAGKASRKQFKSMLNTGDDVIGYCGKNTKLSHKKLKSPKIRVSNGNKLVITVTDPNYFARTDKKDEESQIDTYITLKVHGKVSQKTRTVRLTLRDDGQGHYTPKNSDQKFWTCESVPMGKSAGLKYKITLDDITKRGGHFAEIFCSGDENQDLIPGEDITVTATCSSNEVLTEGSESRTVRTNSLFGSVTVDKYNYGEARAEIRNIRHLENLNSDVSKIPTDTDSSSSETKTYLITSAKQTRDIDWNDFQKDTVDRVNNPDVASAIFSCGDTKWKNGVRTITSGTKMTAGSYYGIFNYNLTEYNGGGHTIKNLVIRNTEHISNDVWRQQGTNVKAGGSLTDVGKGDAGLFRRVATYFTLKNLTLKNADIEGSGDAGALIARVSSLKSGETRSNKVLDKAQIVSDITIKNVLVDGGTVRQSGSDSTGNAGGLIGQCSLHNMYSDGSGWSDGRLKITNTVSTAYVESESGDAGGLIGELDSQAVVKNSYTGGHTRNGKYTLNDSDTGDGYCNVIAAEETETSNRHPSAGGLVGKLRNAKGTEFTNCYSTCSVKGYYAGGFVGYDSGSVSVLTTDSETTYSKCYATGLIGGRYAGTFAGYLKGAQLNEVFYLSGINGDMKGAAVGQSRRIHASAYNDIGGIADIYPRTVFEKPHAYDSTLKSSRRYPYRMVNRVGAKDSDTQFVHYGDWQQPNQEGLTKHIGRSRIFAYIEKNKKSGDLSWYILKSYMDKNGHTHVDEYRRMNVSHKGTMGNTDTSYGILTTKKTFPSNQFSAEGQAGFSHKAEKVEIYGQTFYYYKINDNIKSDEEGKKSTTTYWYFDSAHNKPVQFIFNDCFAAAISYGDWNYGYPGYPYEIRTADQMRSAGDARFNDTSFVLSRNIDLSSITETGPIIKTFKGRFDGNGYKIRGLHMDVSKGSTAGLVGTSSGRLEHIVLTDASLNVSFKHGSAGLLVGTSTGTIRSCSVEGNITCDVSSMNGSSTDAADLGNAVNIGGLAGSVEDGEVTRSSADTSITADYSEEELNKVTDKNLDSKQPFYKRIGGFAGNIGDAGTLKLRIQDCYSKADITWNTGAKIGGFTGFATDTIDTVVRNCYASTKLKDDLSARVKTSSSTSKKASKEEKKKQSEEKKKIERWKTALDSDESQVALFTGRDEQALKKYHSCFGVERSSSRSAKTTKLKVSSYDFMLSRNSINYTLYGKNYILSNAKHKDEMNIYSLTAKQFRDLSSFDGFSSSEWEVVNGLYPTLIHNPEE